MKLIAITNGKYTDEEKLQTTLGLYRRFKKERVRPRRCVVPCRQGQGIWQMDGPKGYLSLWMTSMRIAKRDWMAEEIPKVGTFVYYLAFLDPSFPTRGAMSW